MLKELKWFYDKLDCKTKRDTNKATFFNFIAIILESISIVMIVPILTAIISPEYTKDIIHRLGLSNIIGEYENLALIFSLIFLLSFIFSNIYRIWSSNYLMNILNIYKANLISKLTNSLIEINNYKKEEKTESYRINLLTKEVDLHTQLVFNELINLKRDFILLILAFVIGVYNFGLYLFLILPLLWPLMLLIKKLNNIRIKSLAKKRETAEYFKLKNVKEFFYLIIDIYVKRRSKHFINIVSDSSKNLLDIERKQFLFRQSIKPIAEIYVVSLLMILILLVSNLNNFSREDGLSYMVIVMLFVTKVIPAINKIQVSLYNFEFMSSTTHKLYDIINDLPEKNIQNNKNLENKLIFENVTIKNGDSFLLSVDDFEIKLGNSLRIRGESGSGKSSIFNLILGLKKPFSGSIKAMGETANYSNDALLKKIGYVPQETRLLNASLAENVSFGVKKDLINIEKVKQIIKQVGLNYLVDREKDGIWQKVSSENLELSGGEKQKLGIARALYDNPKLILFDEITTSLDKVSRAEIYDLIKTISSDKNKIILLISHEENVPINFDYEININNGIGKFGSYHG